MEKLYLEDLEVDTVRDLGSRTLGEAEIIAFAREFDPQPFHVDPEAAKASSFGGLIASGWHTASVAMRLAVDGFISQTVSLGSPGVESLRWLKPVRPGDTVFARMRILEVRRSRSKPDRGTMRCTYELLNQAHELVLAMTATGIFGRRPRPEPVRTKPRRL